MKSALIVGALIATLSAAARAASFATAAPAVDFNYTGSTVVWDAPASALYRITAWGASGGIGDPFSFNTTFQPGRGVGLSGVFRLPKGDPLSVAVGGIGQDGSHCGACGLGNFAGGGGGGSFVVANGSPLIIAGGGGGGGGLGAFDSLDQNGGDARFGQAGGGSAAGAVGFGGGAQDGAGGGGFYGDGGSTYDSFGNVQAGGGGGYPGLAGGISAFGPFAQPGNGGFGGGAGAGLFGGGGGGGYSGGGGGDSGDNRGGGGGGSFDAGAQPAFLGYGAPYQYGEVVIQLLPEPSSWAVMLMGLGIAGAAVRRRRSARVTSAP